MEILALITFLILLIASQQAIIFYLIKTSKEEVGKLTTKLMSRNLEEYNTTILEEKYAEKVAKGTKSVGAEEFTEEDDTYLDPTEVSFKTLLNAKDNL